MNANPAYDAERETGSYILAADLSIAMISPNEKRRAAAAESACNICEFSSYLATPADQERLSQLRYDLILIDIDGDTEKALGLVERFSSDGANRVLVFSSEKNPEKLARCMRAGARDFLAFPFQPRAMTEALHRLSAPRAASCACREQSEPRSCSASRGSFWRRAFEQSSMARSQAARR